jgi:putative transposase
MAISFTGAHFPQDISLMGVRWYVAYPLSYRHVEELLEERGVPIDHATIQRWVVKYSPQLEEAFHRRKRPVWVSWRMDETYIKVKGQWYDLYRAVDKTGQTIDFLLTAQRDAHAAKRFLTQAIRTIQDLNNMVARDHRGVKRMTRLMLGFNAFDAAQSTLVGIALMYMLKKRQLVVEEGHEGCTAAEQFYVLAA